MAAGGFRDSNGAGRQNESFFWIEATKFIQTQGVVRKAAPFCGIKHNSACSVMGESVETPKIRHITLKKCIVML